MNLLLLQPTDFTEEGSAVLKAADRRAMHIRSVLKSAPGDKLKAGLVNGNIGRAEIREIDEAGDITLIPELDTPPPPPCFDILLAMPRPKVMRRLWAELAALGAGRIILVNGAKVEKFYFDNHWLNEESWRPLLIEGLEQSCATTLPEVMIKRRLKPFIEDELRLLYPDSPKYIAHPYINTDRGRNCLGENGKRPLVAIGPEGGWTDFELSLFANAGFAPLSLGRRVLRTDTACVAIAGAIGGAFFGDAGDISPAR